MKSMLKMLLSVSVGSMISSTVCADENVNVMSLKTIRAGSHTFQENKVNSERCAELGMTDMTDKIDLEISENASDPLACYFDDAANPSLTYRAVPGMQDFQFTQGTIPYGKYKVQSSVEYYYAFNREIIIMSISVPADKCTVSGTSQTTPPTGHAYLETFCSYPSSRGQRTINAEYGWAGGTDMIRRSGTITLQ